LTLRRRSMIEAVRGRVAESDALREEAASELRSALPAQNSPPADAAGGSSCPNSAEKPGAGDFTTQLRHGDLLIGNGGSAGVPGKLLVFSPHSRELGVLAAG